MTNFVNRIDANNLSLRDATLHYAWVDKTKESFGKQRYEVLAVASSPAQAAAWAAEGLNVKRIGGFDFAVSLYKDAQMPNGGIAKLTVLDADGNAYAGPVWNGSKGHVRVRQGTAEYNGEVHKWSRLEGLMVTELNSTATPQSLSASDF